MKELEKRAVSYYGERLVSLVIFGSVAKDCHSPQSDIDVLIVLTDMRQRYEEYSAFFEHIEKEIHAIRLSPIIKSKTELAVTARWLWDAAFLILYDRDDFFKKFQEALTSYKNTHLVYHDSPMAYFEVLDGQ